MKVVMKVGLDMCAMSCLPRGEAHRAMTLLCAASQGVAKGHSKRMWRVCSGVWIPREVLAEVAYSTDGEGVDAARTDVKGAHLDSVHCVFEAGAEA